MLTPDLPNATWGSHLQTFSYQFLKTSEILLLLS